MISPNPPLTKRSSDPNASSPPRVGAVAKLRRALFAEAVSEGAKYGVGFDRLLEHLWRVRGRTKRFRLHAVRHLGDLVHAIACIDDVGTAWHDLAERHESALIGVGHSVSAAGPTGGDASAVVLARRLMADLRVQCVEETDEYRITLREYHGETPLRRWLTHRLVARVHLASRYLPRRTGGLRLAMPYDQVPPGEHNCANVETASVNARVVVFSPCTSGAFK